MPTDLFQLRLTAQKLNDATKTPQLLHADEVQTWYHGDAEFGTPRAVFYFSLMSPIAVASPRDLALSELFVRMVNRQLDVATYAARLAGLRYELYRHSRGFSVRLSGYEDKQPALLATVLEALRAPKLTADEFDLVKDELQREWKNVALEAPSSQVVHELYRLLLQPYWSEAERLEALQEIDLTDLQKHAEKLIKEVHISALSHGDVTRDRAAEMRAMLRDAFADSRVHKRSAAQSCSSSYPPAILT